MSDKTDIKDKRISIFELAVERSPKGYEQRVKRPVTKTEKVWAYARELTDKEKFAAKSAGVEQSILFKVAYSAAIKAGQYIEFRGSYYRIVSIDKFEFYKRDLSLRAIECGLPEVKDDKQRD